MDNIDITEFNEADIHLIARWRSEPRINAFIRPGRRTLNEVQEWYRDYFSGETNKLYLISYDNDPIGYFTIEGIDHVNRKCEFGIVIGEVSYHNKSIGLSAIELMLEKAFAAMRKNEGAKGDVLAVAQIAGLSAAKRVGELIPLCHTLALDHVSLSFTPDEKTRSLEIRCEVRAEAKTGVEMEAMCAVSVAALTVYDMLKAVDREIHIGDVELREKSGGKSGDWRRGA